MSFIRQILLSTMAVAAALYLWASYVPASHPILERLGILKYLGIEAAAPAGADGARRGFGGGAVRVLVEDVTQRTLADHVRAIGDGKALRAVTVRSEAVGIVTEILVAPGAWVEAGSPLARLDSEAETIALERARIMLANARENFDRLSKLQGNVTEVRLSDAELALRTAELELREAQFDLDRREIRAPIPGWVGLIDVEEGDRMLAQDPLVTITDRSALLIDFRVPERVVPKLTVGTPVSVTPLGLRDRVLDGRIVAIDTIVDRASRTLRVQGRVENDEDLLRVGMAFEVELTFPGDTVLSVPPLSVQWSSEGAYVWAVREGRAQRVPVEIRQRNADNILVEAALTPGEPIVTEGVQNLRPGTEVEIANPSEAAAAGAAPARL